MTFASQFPERSVANVKSAPLVSVTGASGFIGRRLLHTLTEAGHEVRALVRGQPPQGAPATVTWVRGDLGDPHALAALLDGADVVVHAAGAIKALSRSGFMTTNVAGTATLAEVAAAQSTPPRLIYLSSLAAREARISPYAASKAAAEEAVRRLSHRLPVIVLRPPAVYGPGDPETLRIFRMAARGFLPVPAVAGARLSLAHVDDAAAAILAAMTVDQIPDQPIEFDDGAPQGHAWDEIALAAGQALNRPVRTLRLPPGVFYAVGAASGLLAQITRRPTVLSRHKVAEILHPDWVARPTPLPGYRPTWALADGFRNTADWAVSQGLVRMLRRS